MSILDQPVIYTCADHPSFRFRIETVKFRFNNGQLHLTDTNEIALLDEVLKTVPTIALKVKKIDRAAAEAELIKMLKSQNMHSGVVKGPVDSQHIMDSQKVVHESGLADLGASGAQQASVSEQIDTDSAKINESKATNPLVSSGTKSPKLNPLASKLVQAK